MAFHTELATALSWVEGGCPGYPGASTVISQPLDSKMLRWLAIPATQPWAPTHRDIQAPVTLLQQWKERKKNKKKRKGGIEGRQKTKKALTLKKRQSLRENKGCTMLFPTWFRIAATLSQMTYVNPSTYAWDGWLLSNRSLLDPDVQENQHLFVIN